MSGGDILHGVTACPPTLVLYLCILVLDVEDVW